MRVRQTEGMASARTFTPERLFRVFALLETITWTLLIVGMLLKYVVGVGDWPVSIAGFIHGLVFIAYALQAGVVAVNQRWHLGLAALAVASAVFPYATIPVERWLARRGSLEGGWRTDATADPRDARPFDRAFRWALQRPIPLAGGLLVALVAIMATLLFVGPPGGEA
jgi:integral membrane protein